MGFYDEMQAVLNRELTTTENGADAYATSGKKLVDFNFGVSAMRNMSADKIGNLFGGVFNEDRMRALEYLFYLGDIREGIGERKAFTSCLSYLAGNYPSVAKSVMHLVPHYNRWSSILTMLDSESTRETAIQLIKNQLNLDWDNMESGKPVSLCAKWMPSANASSKETKRLAKILINGLVWSEKKYRKTLSALRKYIDVVEVKMSAKDWESINYQSVPSKANLNYSNAFLRNDEERRKKFIEDVKAGKATINAGVLNPHEICRKYRTDQYYSMNIKEYDDTLEELWKGLEDLYMENVLVIRDGSGSMTCPSIGGSATPLDVATALAIYMSEHNSGEWKDRFVTFSRNPEIVDLRNCSSLHDKLEVCYRYDDCSNTDIYKTMMLILNTAIIGNIPAEDMPKMIVICSDMQFDGNAHHLNGSLFDEISLEYEKFGYKLPRICFWNLEASTHGTVPMQENELGLILCSGFSVQTLRMFMSGKIDPYGVLLDVLDSSRYDPVRKAVELS